MDSENLMALSWQTRLLLWLLNKRHDINTIQVHVPPTMPPDLLQVLDEFNHDELHPDDELTFDRDHLEECYQISSENMDGAQG
jgi:hypothetical protein